MRGLLQPSVDCRSIDVARERHVAGRDPVVLGELRRRRMRDPAFDGAAVRNVELRRRRVVRTEERELFPIRRKRRSMDAGKGRHRSRRLPSRFRHPVNLALVGALLSRHEEDLARSRGYVEKGAAEGGGHHAPFAFGQLLDAAILDRERVQVVSAAPIAREEDGAAVASENGAGEPRGVSRLAPVVPERARGAVLGIEEPEPPIDGVLAHLIDEETQRTRRRPAVAVYVRACDVRRLRREPLRFGDGVDLDRAREVVVAGVVPPKIPNARLLAEVVGDGLFPHLRSIVDLDRDEPAVRRPAVGDDLAIESAVPRARHDADRRRAKLRRPDALVRLLIPEPQIAVLDPREKPSLGRESELAARRGDLRQPFGRRSVGADSKHRSVQHENQRLPVGRPGDIGNSAAAAFEAREAARSAGGGVHDEDVPERHRAIVPEKSDSLAVAGPDRSKGSRAGESGERREASERQLFRRGRRSERRERARARARVP